jgi:hypothetical protein
MMNFIQVATLNGELTLSATESGGLLIRLHRKNSPLHEEGELAVEKLPELAAFLEGAWVSAYEKGLISYLGKDKSPSVK